MPQGKSTLAAALTRLPEGHPSGEVDPRAKGAAAAAAPWLAAWHFFKHRRAPTAPPACCALAVSRAGGALSWEAAGAHTRAAP